MPDIFDEVDEDLRHERARALVRRYGVAAIAAAVLVVVGVAGYEGVQWRQARADRAAAAAYIAASAAADVPSQHAAAIAQLTHIADTAPAGYRTLARLRLAALYAADHEAVRADAAWEQVAGDGAAPRAMRDLATLQWAQHAVDAGDPALIESRLQPLVLPGAPFHALARETLALLDLRRNKTRDAIETLRLVAADPAASEDVRARARAMLAQLGDTPAEPGAQSPATPGSAS